MSDVKLSVIIPVYNNKIHLESLFKIFETQTKFGVGFELVCVDDGSTDGSGELLDSFWKTVSYPVKIIHKENGGVSSARNIGLENAQGEYIAFADADDDISEDYMDFFSRAALDLPKLIVFQSKRIRADEAHKPDEVNEKLEIISKADMLSLMITCPTDFGVYNLFIRKDILENNKLKFAEGYKYYEDYDFLYRIFCFTDDIVFTKKQLYFYILNPSSAMQRFTRDRVDCVELLEGLKPIIEKSSPKSLRDFEAYGINRIWWSVMWQAALAFSTKDALRFAHDYDVSKHMRTLWKHPQIKVSLSAVLFSFSERAFIMMVKLFGKRRSKVKRVFYDEFLL